MDESKYERFVGTVFSTKEEDKRRRSSTNRMKEDPFMVTSVIPICSSTVHRLAQKQLTT